MKLGSFRELFLFLLSDIYAVENQLLVDLPMIAKKVSSEDLKEAIRDHLAETKDQVKRLEKVFGIMGEKPLRVEWSHDIKTLFTDGEKFLRSNPSSPLVDAAIIVMCQRVEHFEIATYGSLVEFADTLDNSEIKSLLKDSLKEEGHANKLLTKLAEGRFFSSGINEEAIHNL